MSDQAAARINTHLRALLTNPAPVAALPSHWLTARSLRLGVDALDAVQILALGLLTWALFPDVAAAFGLGEAAGIGALAALLAAAARRAARTTGHAMPAPIDAAAGRAAGAVAFALGLTAAICWLALAGGRAAPDGLLGWFAAWAACSIGVAAALRYGAAKLAASIMEGQRIVVVGPPVEADGFARSVALAPSGHWRLAGRIHDGEADGLDRLATLVERRDADMVAMVIGGPDAVARTTAVCARMSGQPVRVCLALDVASLAHVPQALTCIGQHVLVELVADPHAGLNGTAKRTMDLVLSALALLFLFPALLLVAIAIRLESPGPVFFCQSRFGRASRPIRVFKFRTMRADGCDQTGERRTTAKDPRVTRIGRFLRRSSIDELPQLINVLRGDMSLVGPRPHPLPMRVEGAYYFEAVEQYRARHLVRPGITGWAQVNGSRGEIDTLEKARRRVQLDLWYLSNWSLALDFRVIMLTVLGGFASPRAD